MIGPETLGFSASMSPALSFLEPKWLTAPMTGHFLVPSEFPFTQYVVPIPFSIVEL